MRLFVGVIIGRKRALMELSPTPAKSPAQILDRGRVQFEAGGEVLGPGLTVAIKLEKPRKPPVSAEEGGKLEFELVKLQERFLVEQDVVGPRLGVLDQFNDADGLAVIERNANQIGLIANQTVFGAVLQAVDMSSNAAFEVSLNFHRWEKGQLGV